MEEMTFFAMIYRSKLITIIYGAELEIAFETYVKATSAFSDGNYGGIYAVKIV
jgi:hypothetical protein